MKVENSRKAEQREQTIRKLKNTARMLFSKNGYEKTSTEEIVKQSQVTRGALYYYFSGKKDLFKAVFDDINVDIANEIFLKISEETNIWQRLLQGTFTFLNMCMNPGIQRIVLIDGPAVLGWQEWREIDEQRSMVYLQNILRDLFREQGVHSLPIDSTAHFISGATNELALWITQAERPKQALEEAHLTIELFLEGLLIDQKPKEYGSRDLDTAKSISMKANDSVG